MKKLLLVTLVLTTGVSIYGQNVPQTKKVDQTDEYFGKKISDPYRWLEDDNSEDTKLWVKEQNRYTNMYLDKIPFRMSLNKRLTQLWNFEKESAPFRKAGMLFYYRNDGVQNQSVLYVKQNEKDKGRALLDPNKLSVDGTISLSSVGISKTGKYLAYAYAKAGSDWNTIRIIDVETGQQVDEEISWIKFSGIDWAGDEGFFYSRYDAPKEGKELSASNEYQKVYWHKLGEPVATDKIVYEDPAHPKRGFYAAVTENEDYVIISATESTSGNAVYVAPLKGGEIVQPFTVMIDDFESDNAILDIENGKALLLTNNNASNKKIVRVALDKSYKEQKEEVVVPETKDLLESATLADGKLILNYLHDVSSKITIHDMQGKLLYELKLPGIGKVNSINFNKKDTEGYVDFSTFTAPTAIYKLVLKDKVLLPYFKATTPFKSEDYETKQVFYQSKDGTKIPMFIVAKKGIKLDGTNPCFLFGYGGFNSYYSPEFRIDRCVFLEQGGVYAIPGIRGGGEYGEDWHQAGTVLKKQNVFDDFIAAAEYLIANKYTSKEKLAIHGRSNGGLLIGAVITQRPDLCKVAIPAVGVLDMLRYHKFTIGWAWATDYGTSEDPKQFAYLRSYSPLHNVKSAAYPATLITTGDHDDRVVPAHSFKFAATLQEMNKGANPILIRVDMNAGHGAGKPTSKQIDEYADMWSFVFYNLGIKPNY